MKILIFNKKLKKKTFRNALKWLNCDEILFESFTFWSPDTPENIQHCLIYITKFLSYNFVFLSTFINNSRISILFNIILFIAEEMVL